jgi:hypothetical protein
MKPVVTAGRRGELAICRACCLLRALEVAACSDWTCTYTSPLLKGLIDNLVQMVRGTSG